MKKAIMIIFLLTVFSGAPASPTLALQQTAFVLALEDDRMFRLSLPWAATPEPRWTHRHRHFADRLRYRPADGAAF